MSDLTKYNRDKRKIKELHIELRLLKAKNETQRKKIDSQNSIIEVLHEKLNTIESTKEHNKRKAFDSVVERLNKGNSKTLKAIALEFNLSEKVVYNMNRDVKLAMN